MSKGHKASLSLPVVHQKAAGIDIGSRFHVIAVPPDMCQEPVQTFQAFAYSGPSWAVILNDRGR